MRHFSPLTLPKKLLSEPLLFTVLLLSLPYCSVAQGRIINGVVTEQESEQPLPGVNVVVKGTSIGTITDIEGQYQLSIPPDAAVVVFSFIGLVSQEVEIGEQSTINIALASDVSELSEVVVTAVGIERDRKALGYAVTNVEGEQLQQKSAADPVRALSGKVPGVNIQGSGGAVGSGTNVTIRGNSSLTQNTQPLFVVDGVPFDNSVFESTGTNGSGGAQYTNRAFDIDPNNIKSMTVLKGASAAALYGSRAANGVVVITTKSGAGASNRGFEVTFNSSYAIEQVSGLPDYQSTFGSGQHQNLVVGFNGSLGPRFDEFDSVRHVYDAPHLATLVPEYQGQLQEYRAYPNNAKDFLQTGSLLENSIQLNYGGERASFTGGFSRMNNQGIIPNSEISRTSVNVGGRATLENGLFINANVNYVQTNQATPQVNNAVGESSSVVERLLLTPIMYDLSGLPFEDPVTHANLYNRSNVDNPYWVAKYAPYTSDVDRVFGKIQVGYDLADWLTVSYQVGFNAYNDRRKDVIQKGSYNTPLGRITIDNIYREELDANLLITATRDLTNDISLRAILGHNVNQRLTQRNTEEGNGIIVFGNNNFTNTAAQRVIRDEQFKQRFQGVFGDLQFAYKDIYFLNLVARNDWSSTLPADNRSYFYPGVSASVIFTDALGIQSGLLNFGKLRAGITRVGNEAEPYKTRTPFITNSQFNETEFPFTSEGITYNALTLSDNSGSPNLKPEFITEFEVGTELLLLNNRVGLDVTYYDKRTTNSIAQVVLPPSSGFSTKLTNIGELRNSGIEVGLDLTPVSLNSGFTWNIYTAFTRNRNIVEDLGGADQIVVGGRPEFNILVVHQPGEPFGQLYGPTMLRDDEGNLVIQNSQLGRPLPGGLDIIGDPNPDFIVGITNTITFEGITLSALFDYKHGGDMWSYTAQQVLGRGVVDLGDREAGRVIPGVLGNEEGTGPLLDENGNKVPNTIVLANYDWWFTNSFGFTDYRDVHTYDASVVRLREVSLAYGLPTALLEKTPFGSVRLTLSGRNLWYFAPNFPEQLNFDPETAATSASNYQGLDFIGVPTTRRFGVNLNATF